MKKLVLTLFFTTKALLALPVGNPADPTTLLSGLFWNDCPQDPCCAIFSFKFGFYGDYVFNRNLSVRNDSISNSKNLEKTTLSTNAGYLILGIYERADLFATFGTTNLTFEGQNIFTTGRFSLNADSFFSWSVGGRWTLWQCGLTSIGIESQFFAWKPAVSRVSFASSGLSIHPRGLNLNWQEWQIAGGISHRFKHLIPYIAVKYTRCFAKYRINTKLFEPFDFFSPSRFESQKRWGYAFGLSLIDVCRMSVTTEARFGDEKAFHLNGQIRF